VKACEEKRETARRGYYGAGGGGNVAKGKSGISASAKRLM